MFNNPFDSFHNTVAEAKEEREQLDRLLTISTPRERLIVVGIAFLLCVLVAWLFFGSVARQLTLDGALVGVGDGESSVEVLVWIESDVASEIEPGMPVVIELATPGMPAVIEQAMTDGTSDTLAGEVVRVSALSVPDGMAASAPVTPHRVGIAFAGWLLFPAGGECRIVIELGRQAPVALFGMRRQ